MTQTERGLNNPIEKQLHLSKEARELINLVETHTVNGIAQPISLLFKKPPEETPDDTLSRLENLANPPPEPKYREQLVGGIYSLSKKGEYLGQYLIVLPNLFGNPLVIKIALPPNLSEDLLRRIKQKFSRPCYIKIEGNSATEVQEIQKKPLLYILYPDYAPHRIQPKDIEEIEVVYRSDEMSEEEIRERVSKDYEEAIRHSTEEKLARNKIENLQAVIEALKEGAKRAADHNPTS